MAADVKFTVNKAKDEQALIPATVSEELETKFVKKTKSFSIKLIPISFIVAAVILAIIFVVVYFLNRLIISALALFCIILPIYSIYDAIATSKAPIAWLSPAAKIAVFPSSETDRMEASLSPRFTTASMSQPFKVLSESSGINWISIVPVFMLRVAGTMLFSSSNVTGTRSFFEDGTASGSYP